MANTDTAPEFAEASAGAPGAGFAQAILDEHQWRVPITHPGVVTYQGVPTWGPGDPVATSHPGFAALHADGALERIER